MRAQLLLKASRERRLWEICDVWFAVMYWVRRFCSTLAELARGLAADSGDTSRVMLVIAGW